MISFEREAQLKWLWDHETNEEETQEWRDDLTEEEQILVEQWDDNFYSGFARWQMDIDRMKKNRKDN